MPWHPSNHRISGVTSQTHYLARNQPYMDFKLKRPESYWNCPNRHTNENLKASTGTWNEFRKSQQFYNLKDYVDVDGWHKLEAKLFLQQRRIASQSWGISGTKATWFSVTWVWVLLSNVEAFNFTVSDEHWERHRWHLWWKKLSTNM